MLEQKKALERKDKQHLRNFNIKSLKDFKNVRKKNVFHLPQKSNFDSIYTTSEKSLRTLKSQSKSENLSLPRICTFSYNKHSPINTPKAKIDDFITKKSSFGKSRHSVNYSRKSNQFTPKRENVKLKSNLESFLLKDICFKES